MCSAETIFTPPVGVRTLLFFTRHRAKSIAKKKGPIGFLRSVFQIANSVPDFRFVKTTTIDGSDVPVNSNPKSIHTIQQTERTQPTMIVPLKDIDLEDGLKNISRSTHLEDDDHSLAASTTMEGTTPRERKLAERESTRVRRTKYFVMLFLLFIMVGVSAATYHLISKQEYEEFHRQFKEDSHKVLSTMGSNLVRTLQASDAFVVSMSSLAAATNQSWPFVVIPDFAVRAEKIRSLANAVYVNTYHLVEPSQRREWETFTAQHGEAMINESIATIENFDGADWPIVWNYTLWDVIHDYDEFELENPGQVGVDSMGPWLPIWQTQPTVAYDPPYNWDLTSSPPTAKMNTTAYQRLIDSHKVTITDAYLISYPGDEDRIANDKDEAEWISSYLLGEEEPIEPISDIYYPIFTSSNRQIELDDEHHHNQYKVAGIFSLSVYWRDTIKNILPVGADGLVAVFENPCNPTFTYRINGPEVEFLGTGDLHDKEFDEMPKTCTLSEMSQVAMQESLYSGIQLDEEFCPFTISIYPSDVAKNRHITNTPIYFAVVTVIIFAVTASTFILYDFWVERRQRVLMKTAITTTKLVTSLFPEVVIDQMLNPSLEDMKSSGDSPKRLKSFLKDGISDSMYANSEIEEVHPSKPIAELFPDTTVYFADIAGFTAWSSVREPSHVFVLLETLYGAFDKLAKQHGIFKVETIGDSYVAVCGLPEPRKNHVVRMARFAFACREKMKEKTREMELTLGPGTAELGLRTGLHSGPTIAGKSFIFFVGYYWQLVRILISRLI